MSSKGLPDESGRQSLKTTKCLKKLLKQVFVTTVSSAHLKARGQQGRQFNGARQGGAGLLWSINAIGLTVLFPNMAQISSTQTVCRPHSPILIALWEPAAGEALELNCRVLSLPKAVFLKSQRHWFQGNMKLRWSLKTPGEGFAVAAWRALCEAECGASAFSGEQAEPGIKSGAVKGKGSTTQSNLCTRHTTGHATSRLPLLLQEIKFAGKSVIKAQTNMVQCLLLFIFIG